MKPPPFAYHAPLTLPAALAALAGEGAQGKVLAGGQSLIPLLNMRLAAPAALIDIGGVTELDTLECAPGGVRVGALARHARVERAEEVFAVQPLLRQALRQVAHPVIRNRGTVVGSLAHADPAAELPAVLAVVEGTVQVAAAGRAPRTVRAADLFTGPLETSLAPGDLITSAFFPALPPAAGTGFAELSRRHGDYALAGVAVLLRLDGDLRVTDARAGYLGVAPVPLVLDLTDAAGGLRPGETDWAAAANMARGQVDPDPDIHASSAYRRHLAGVLTARALARAGSAAVAAAGGSLP